jgi:hypothetical protein
MASGNCLSSIKYLTRSKQPEDRGASGNTYTKLGLLQWSLINQYPSEEQKALSKGLIAFKDVSELNGPEVDIFAELRCHIQRMRDVPLSEWEPEEKASAIISFKQVSQYIARASDIPMPTNNNLACNVCSQHFAAESNGVLLIQDEDSKEVEVIVGSSHKGQIFPEDRRHYARQGHIATPAHSHHCK